MKTSAQGIKLLHGREGCRLKPYQDTVGVWTDGWGNTHGVIPNGPPITQEKADADFARHLEAFEQAINDSVTVGLEPYQFDALVSFSFNVGVGAFQTSTLLRKVNLGRFELVPAQFDRWHIPPEITRRRNGEREQFKGTHFVAQYP